MKFALVDDYRPCVVVEGNVVDVAIIAKVLNDLPPWDRMPYIIEHHDSLRQSLDALGPDDGVPLSSVRVREPLVLPTKMLSCVGNYMEGLDHKSDIDMFLKSPDSIIGPGDTVVLPDVPVDKVHHEAELAVVIGRTVHGKISEDEAADAVFGYTGVIDVSGRGFGRASFIGKSFDTFAPLGPYLVTRDEITDPQDLHVTLSVDGELRQDYSTADMEHPVPELVAWAANVVTLRPGDIITCGTNHMGLGFLRDGESIEFEIGGIGVMTNPVADPLKRSWPKGIDPEVVEAAKRWRQGDRSQVNV